MKIICTQIQDGGRTHEIGGIDYHFKHDEAIGAQVCEVTEQAHIDRFLSITEAFYECQPAPAVEEAPVDDADPVQEDAPVVEEAPAVPVEKKRKTK